MSVNYNNRYVAFLDILGFKNMVCESEKNLQILDVINKALDYTRTIQHENYEGEYPMSELGKQVSVFSDSIVISYKMETGGAGFNVLVDLIYICNDLLSLGILVRGGVTIGQLIHEDNKCFGPAMVEAYRIETKIAKYPRIIIDPEVITYDLKYRGENNTLEFEKKYIRNLIDYDEDGLMYLDYLGSFREVDEDDVYLGYLCKVKKFIIDSISSFSGNQEILSKYGWLKSYFNKTVRKFCPSFNQLLIQ